jgi:hypothetical protein
LGAIRDFACNVSRETLRESSLRFRMNCSACSGTN